MMPPCSYLVPTMNPVMFWANKIGVSERLQSWMNWAPLLASSLNRMPLFARIPIGRPPKMAQPVTRVVPYSGLNSSNSPPSTIRRSPLAPRNGTRTSAEAMPRSSRGS